MQKRVLLENWLFFCFFSVPPAFDHDSQFNYTALRECNEWKDCRLSQCHKMSNLTPSGKIGYCVPFYCKSDSDCFDIGDVCTTGFLSGTCNSMKQGGTCEYHPDFAVARCGKKQSKN